MGPSGILGRVGLHCFFDAPAILTVTYDCDDGLQESFQWQPDYLAGLFFPFLEFVTQRSAATVWYHHFVQKCQASVAKRWLLSLAQFSPCFFSTSVGNAPNNVQVCRRRGCGQEEIRLTGLYFQRRRWMTCNWPWSLGSPRLRKLATVPGISKRLSFWKFPIEPRGVPPVELFGSSHQPCVKSLDSCLVTQLLRQLAVPRPIRHRWYQTTRARIPCEHSFSKRRVG